MARQQEIREFIGARLRGWRRARRWPLKLLAYDLGVSISVISGWERGTRFPSIEHLVHIAALFGKPVCQLFCSNNTKCEVCRLALSKDSPPSKSAKS